VDKDELVLLWLEGRIEPGGRRAAPAQKYEREYLADWNDKEARAAAAAKIAGNCLSCEERLALARLIRGDGPRKMVIQKNGKGRFREVVRERAIVSHFRGMELTLPSRTDALQATAAEFGIEPGRVETILTYYRGRSCAFPIEFRMQRMAVAVSTVSVSYAAGWPLVGGGTADVSFLFAADKQADDRAQRTPDTDIPI
jgi:hypothetical protein